MCQLRVRLLFADNRETLLDEVTDISFADGHITVARLFDAPQTLYGFDINSINCLRNEVLLAQRKVTAENGDA